ncbi:capsule assembly Wzi family protein [Thermodesulfovibrio yellowstonii]|nr:capsule assembly Wzi family protein [Thermodesulfovibrio islandicus]
MAKKLLILIFTLSVTLLLGAFSVNASTYLPLDDEVYDILSRLEAEGVIQSGLLTTRPLSYKELKRLIIEAQRNSINKTTFIKSLLRSLKERFKDETRDVKYIKPLYLLYSRYVYADSEIQALYYNNDGDHYEKGSNLRIGFASRAELEWLSFYINPELKYSDAENNLIAKRFYGVMNFLGLELTLGKDSQWWGPGYHGAILLSNNPEPMKILRITNSQPVLLPGIFKYLGLCKFTFFATRLDKERNDISEPYLWGMRLNFKPHPYIEMGFQRTALLGGKGRPEGFKTWWYSFIGKGENLGGVEAGDQRAGFDIKLTLPFKWQPLQLYGEAAGEDEAGGLPSKWAYLMGLYLPRILNFERIGFRVEYANTHVPGYPNVWYRHHIYHAGYTYKGRIIGHHIGTDSRDIFLELSYLIPEIGGKISFSYDIEEHNLSASIREKKYEATSKVGIRLTKSVQLEALYNYGRIENFGNIPGKEKKINTVTTMIKYNF